MIEIIDKRECSGCTACSNVCPKSAISMIEDNEGFLYPKVKKDICIHCDLCDKVCPYKNEDRPEYDLEKCFASINTSDEQREKSSSGGMFVLLADSIIKNGGMVFGAAFDKTWCVYHRGVDNTEDLQSLIGSKYMQSVMGNVFSQIAEILKSGRKILFVGTTCHVNGLKNFLQKEYTNLYCVDFICLGVPSAKIWRDYLDTFFGDYNIKSINFKEKSLGWHHFSLNINGEKKRFKRNGRKTYFYTGYFRHLYTRPSCSNCVYKMGNRYSDITIADCWGYHKIAPEMDDNKGMSSVVCHTDKGLMLFDSLKANMKWKDTDLKDILEFNSGYRLSTATSDKREEFWKDYEILSKKKLFKKYCKPQKKRIVIRIVIRILRKIKKCLT